MKTYEITLKNCAFFANHGVNDEEKKLGQRFFIDAALTVVLINSDDIEETVDYGKVFSTIEKTVVYKKHFHLIETLALEIAQDICNKFSLVKKAVITVRKPAAPVKGVIDHVEVKIAWPE